MAVAVDVGELIFRGILQMSAYPGSPFTGNIYRDLVMFLLIPSIFIILIIYMMVGRILPPEYTRLRLLVGVGAYLFIIAGGLYPAFAYLAGPYFIVLVFILGLVFFILEHFYTRESPGGGRTGYAVPASISNRKHHHKEAMIAQRMHDMMKESAGSYDRDTLYEIAKKEIDWEEKHGKRR